MATPASTATRGTSTPLVTASISNQQTSLEAAAREEIAGYLPAHAPIFLRLAFHDAGTYDAESGTGGPNGSIRFTDEYKRDENKGMEIAIKPCNEIRDKVEKRCGSTLSHADIYQLAGIMAVEKTGGPKIEFAVGRKDADSPSPVDRLPKAGSYDNLIEAAVHLRNVFYRMGFTDREIVALSGAHTLGEAHQDRSGYHGSWTAELRKFDNSYFRNLLNRAEQETSKVPLPSDKCLITDQTFQRYVHLYAEDEKAFFRDYAKAHKKMSELGFQQFPKRTVYGEKDFKDMMPGMFVAAVVTIAVALLGIFYRK